MLTDDMIFDLTNGLQNIFGSEIYQIILYGSAARNEATEESDIDIAILLTKEMDTRVRDRFIDRAAKIDRKYGKVFSIVDISREKMEQWGNVLPFYRNIRKEGIVLWAA